MVHADASNFSTNVTKAEAYAQVYEQAQSLFEGQRNWVWYEHSVEFPLLDRNLANASSLLWHAYKSLPSPSKDVNWAGFYVIDSLKANQLILGPFHGKVACQTISFHRGVCGAAASTATTQLVDDVEAFPGHIACDGDSKSEIVVPILAQGKVVAIIDIDCAVLNGFDALDKEWLEKLAELLGKACDWPAINWQH